MSEADSSDKSPKAIIHKQILDIAEANPEAPLERIADEVSGASTELVERVLEKYGDPADDSTQQPPSTDTSAPEPTTTDTKYGSIGLAREEDHTAPQALEHNNDEEAVSADRGDEEAPAQSSENQKDNSGESEVTEMAESGRAGIEELSEEQREVLRAISEHPEATQEELAEQFDVTAGTISRWVNEIPEFEWQQREEFVASYVESSGTVSDGGIQTEGTSKKESMDAEERLDTLEGEVDSIQDHIRKLEEGAVSGEAAHSSAIDPELMAKVVRACIADDQINNDEEITIITKLLR